MTFGLGAVRLRIAIGVLGGSAMAATVAVLTGAAAVRLVARPDSGPGPGSWKRDGDTRDAA
ncbi:hypothetical protein ACL02T_16770 [Pseudonocardia sp. RS010]|uniref:hypothetical protein n=1 Tax=Pseudonocardia sp. RS010 TaxID=3385979 RepID=UPI00399F6EA0